jgi:iron complex transport system substrate-binding protein
MSHRLHLLLLAFTVAVSACAAPAPDPSPSASAGPAFPLTLTDDAGREVTIAAEPQRIVSLAPSNTEIVCALDACDRLVGVTDADDYPAEVTDIPDVVILAVVDVEKVVAAEPDLVLAAGNELTSSAVIAQLEDLDLPVLVLYPESLDEVFANILLVGEALGATSTAEALVADLEAQRDELVALVADAPRPRTFYEVGVFEGTIYTAGEDSFLASLIDLAGGEPVLGDPLSTAIALEDLVAADPELILLGDATWDPSITPESVAARSGWESLTAVLSGEVFAFEDDLIVTRPGPRIVDGLAALVAAIHPELSPGT